MEKIKNRLLLWFLIVTLTPLLIVGILSYWNASQTVKDEVTANLIYLAKSRADTLHTYLIEKETDLLVISRLPMVLKAVESYEAGFNNGGLHSSSYKAVNKRFGVSLKSIKESFGFYDLFFISKTGDVTFTVEHEDDLGTNLYYGLYKDTELAIAFRDAVSTIALTSSSLKQYQPSGESAMFIVIPVFDDDLLLGLLAVQLDRFEFNNVVADYTGLGSTGETVIASMVGNNAMFITPTRHDKNAAFNRVIEYDPVNVLPIQMALSGERGSGISYDYRGEEVLAAWRYFPHQAWGIVVKIDVAEAFSSVDALFYKFLFITGLATGAVVLLSTIISKTIARPIVELTNAVNVIALGDMSNKVEVSTNDELAVLANSFNHMVKELNLAREDLLTQRDQIELVNISLERKVDELDQFTYVASHDLQEPLRKIMSFSALLRADVGEGISEDADKDICFINDAATRMRALIQDLLSLSRSDKMEMECERFKMDECVDSALVSLEVSLKESGAKIVRNGVLPEVYGDSTMLTLLYQNLIGNAIKFNDKGSPIITITCQETEEGTVFGVKDRGIGIKPEYIKQVFMPFKRLHGRSEFKGSGVGLSICKKIVERHRGRFWVESKPGKGSHFFFIISTK